MAKLVLITGCSTGFGRKLVPMFLDAGWHVLATMRRAGEREGLFSEERNRYGQSLRLLSCDVTDPADRDRLTQTLLADYSGRLDCLVNNAGIGAFGAAEEVSETSLRLVMETNFTSVALLTKALLPSLRASRGRVITVSSVFGVVGFPLTSLYCASKHAVEGYMESLAYEMAPFGVKVCLVEPGGHRTEFMGNSNWQRQEQSPYAKLALGYSNLQRKLMTGKATPPDKVCQSIVRLAQAKNPPLRTYVGNDARLTRASHALIPRNWLVGLLGRLYHRVLLRMGRSGV